jgi:hypothetical protein
MSWVRVLALSLLVLQISACADKDDLDAVIEAQECLDKFARTGAGDLATCESKVGSLTTPAAYGIRCSSGFIREGITASGLITAFQAIDTMSPSNMATFLSLISFDAAGTGTAGPVATNLTTAETVFNHCASSLAKGASIISSFSMITNALMKHSCDNNGMVFLTFTGSCNASATDVGGALASIAAGGASTWTLGNPVSTLGTIVLRAREISCLTGSANETLCEFYDRAVQGGGSDPTAVGQAFVNALLSP